MYQASPKGIESVDKRRVPSRLCFAELVMIAFGLCWTCSELCGQNQNRFTMTEVEILNLLRTVDIGIAEAIVGANKDETACIVVMSEGSARSSQVTRSGILRTRLYRSTGVMGRGERSLSDDSAKLIWEIFDNPPSSVAVDTIPMNRRLLFATRRDGVMSGIVYDSADFPDDILTLLRALPEELRVSAVVPAIEPKTIRVVDENRPVTVASAASLSGFVCATETRLLYAECPENQSLKFSQQWVAPAGLKIVDCTVSHGGETVAFMVSGPHPNLYSLPITGWELQSPKMFDAGIDSRCTFTSNYGVVVTSNSDFRTKVTAFRLIDAIPPQLQSRFQQNSESLYRFSSDGRLALLHEKNGSVVLHDTEKPDVPKTLMTNVTYISAGEFSPDNKRLALSCTTASAGRKTLIIEIGSTVPPKSLFLYDVLDLELTNAIWTPDSLTLLGQHRATGFLNKATSRGIHAWDAGSGKHLQSYTGTPNPRENSNAELGIAIFDEGKTLIGGSRHGSVYLWNLN